jgi:uncharacterized protein with PQ loop repeat
MITKIIIENSLIIAAEIFWISSNFSQLKKLVKGRDSRGLSAPSQTLNAAGNIAWVSYFFSRQLFVPVVTNASMMLLTLLILFYTLDKNKKQFSRGLTSIIIIAPITAYVLIAMPEIAGWTAVAYNLIAVSPWIYRVVSTKKVTGISERSIHFSIGAMLCTLAYALMINSSPLVVGATLGLIYMTIIMRYYYTYRATKRTPSS